LLHEAVFIAPNVVGNYAGEQADLLRIFDPALCVKGTHHVMQIRADQMPPQGSITDNLIQFLIMSRGDINLVDRAKLDFLDEYDLNVMEQALEESRLEIIRMEAEMEHERAEKEHERAKKENMLRSSVLGFHKLGQPIESIAQTLGVTVDQVEAILAKN